MVERRSFWCVCVVALVGGVAMVGAAAACAPAWASSETGLGSGLTGVDPLRVLEAGGVRVVVEASGAVTYGGRPLEDVDGRGGLGQGGPAVGAAVLGGYLLVAQRDGVVLLYELPAGGDGADPAADARPVLAQRLADLGRGLVDIAAVPEAGRALVLAAGTTEVFGVRLHEAADLAAGRAKAPAYVDHARFFEFVRPDPQRDGAAPGDAPSGDAIDTPRLLAAGPQSLAMVTEGHLYELFHLDRSYRVLSRSPLPEGVARVDAIAHGGSAWVLAGLDAAAEPVLLAARSLEGPWADLGVAALDAALADALGGGEPIAWLPGRLSASDREVTLAIRGERPALASWPASAASLEAKSVTVRALKGEAEAAAEPEMGAGGGE